MKPTRDLRQLCETWWERLAKASKDEHSQAAEQFLAWFGWTDPAPVACPGDVNRMQVVSYLLEQGTQASAAAFLVMPGLLKSPAVMHHRFLDFTETTRILVNATRSMNVRYAFISDLFRAYLYDSSSDELLLSADSPSEIMTEFGTVLEHARVQEGSLDDLRRQPRSHVARQLREWGQSWHDTLVSEWQAPDDSAWLAVDRLVLLRYMAERNTLNRAGWQLRPKFMNVVAMSTRSNPEGAGRELVRLYHEIYRDWNVGLYAPEGRMDAILEQDAVSASMIRELALLSRNKFQLWTVLESFNYGEAAEKARVRMIPEENEERMLYLAKQTLETVDEVCIELDLQEEGYRALFYWFDQLTGFYERMSREYEQMEPPAEPESTDLFAWSEANANQPHAIRDPFQHAFEKGFRVYHASDRQRRTARLMLHLHLIERSRQEKSRIVRFPQIEACLEVRPRMLDSDRRRLFEGQAESEWEAM